jgi:DNA helicase-2/ATP-dependent DNA helicase PcrA
VLESPEQLADLLGVPFSTEQLEAITAPLEPAVIIAGAGTGKTTVMAARVVWLVGTGQVRPEQVLGLTFTRKAALELSQRVDRSLARAGMGEADGIQTVLTYDAFAGRLLGDHGLRVGVESDQVLITDATRYRLAAKVVEQHRGPLENLGRFVISTVVQRLLKLDAEMSSHLVDEAEIRAHSRDFALELAGIGSQTNVVQEARGVLAAREELLGLVREYRALKTELGMAEFADQMASVARLVAASPQVAGQVRDQFRVVLLDEYQDTSSAQAQLLRGLFGDGHPVTAVGDPFQAIYGWRGAAPSNILQFVSDFPRADGAPAGQYSLRTNRRSRPAILDAANDLAAPLRADPRLHNDTELRSPPGSSGGQVRSASFDTWLDEVEWVADQVVATHRERPERGWAEIAVLTRTNGPIGTLFNALAERDVPVEIVGLGGLLDVPEIADIVATLHLIEDVTANDAVVRLLSGPRWNLGAGDLKLLGDRARQLSRQSPEVAGDKVEATAQLCLLDAVEDPGPLPFTTQARERLAGFAAELRQLRRHRDEPLLELVQRIIESSGIARELDSDPDWWAAGRSRQLVQFVDAVAGYVDIDGDGALGGLLAWLEAERDQAEGLDQAVPSNADSVKLLTAHRAKGLEWDVVFLPILCEKVFPNDGPPDNWVRNAQVLPAELRGDHEWVPQLGEVSKERLASGYAKDLREAQREQEDRLIHVAITRARDTLVVSHHYWAAGKTEREPSPYFEGLAVHAGKCGLASPPVEPSTANPLAELELRKPWPAPVEPARLAAAQQAADALHAAQARQPASVPAGQLDAEQQAAGWHRAAQVLVAAARDRREQQRTVGLPPSLSASALLVANRNPEAFIDQLVRPMPRPTGLVAGVGTRFHAWLEQFFGVNALFDPDELSEDDPAEPGSSDMLLQRLIKAFEEGEYAGRTPVRVEEPFILVVGDQQVRGRIDAVFATPGDPDHDYQVVDWKTSNKPADPLQLSLYRLAWAEAMGVPVDRVDAVFFHVLANRVERPARLLDRPEVVDLLANLAS